MHWKLNDPVGLAVRRLAEVFFFFHPAVWWAGRKWEEAMELACDRALFRTEAEAQTYAGQLYRVLANRAAHGRPSFGSGLFATRTQIGKRIAALLTDPLRSPARLSALSIAVLIALTLISLSVGCNVREAEEKAKNDKVAAAPTPAPAPSVPAPSAPAAKPELVWGKEVNGLRAAFEFVPEKESYSIGETLGVRLHVRNASDGTIQIARVSGETDRGHWIVEDPQGAITHGDRARWTGRRKVDRRVLPPGESAVLEVKSLALAKPGKRVPALVGVYVNEPGPYSFRYQLVFGQKAEGDWSGELQTGRRKITIATIANNTLAWGKVVNGLRAAVEFPPEKQSYLIGEKISTRIHIQNATSQTINRFKAVSRDREFDRL